MVQASRQAGRQVRGPERASSWTVVLSFLACLSAEISPGLMCSFTDLISCMIGHYCVLSLLLSLLIFILKIAVHAIRYHGTFEQSEL